jgi:hypothetical protein
MISIEGGTHVMLLIEHKKYRYERISGSQRGVVACG